MQRRAVGSANEAEAEKEKGKSLESMAGVIFNKALGIVVLVGVGPLVCRICNALVVKPAWHQRNENIRVQEIGCL